MLFLKCFKENLIDTTGSDWASVLIFHSFFSLFLGSPVQGKRKKNQCEGKREGKKKMQHSWKLIHKTTPVFLSDKTSVAKGQGDLHGKASKEKDTGWKWKNMKSTPLSFPLLPKEALISIRKMACSFSVACIPKQYKAGEIKERRKQSSTLYQRLRCSSDWINYHSAG